VRNTGTITATLGKVTLASGNTFALDFYGDQLLKLAVGDSIAADVKDVATGLPLGSLVKNEGLLKANGGQVTLTAATARKVVDSVINNTGVIEANSFQSQNGKVVLGTATASTKVVSTPVQTVKVSGSISVAGKKAKQTGGTVAITGENIALFGANIDASGQAGGGKVLIGGDVGGGKGNATVAWMPQAALEAWPMPTATSVSVDAATTINATAIARGDGGKVVVWSDQMTSFAGLIKATGGTQRGKALSRPPVTPSILPVSAWTRRHPSARPEHGSSIRPILRSALLRRQPSRPISLPPMSRCRPTPTVPQAAPA